MTVSGGDPVAHLGQERDWCDSLPDESDSGPLRYSERLWPTVRWWALVLLVVPLGTFGYGLPRGSRCGSRRGRASP
jgi:hypothetical protein